MNATAKTTTKGRQSAALYLSEEDAMMLPMMSEQERQDLEAEAGRELSNAQAHAFRLRKVHRQAVDQMLEE